MGKLKENWLLILVNFTLGILTVIVSISVAAKQSENTEEKKQFKLTLNSKLDIKEFNKHETANKEYFNKIEQERIDDKLKTDNKLDELLRISITTQTNVSWLIGEKKKGN